MHERAAGGSYDAEVLAAVAGHEGMPPLPLPASEFRLLLRGVRAAPHPPPRFALSRLSVGASTWTAGQMTPRRMLVVGEAGGEAAAALAAAVGDKVTTTTMLLVLVLMLLLLLLLRLLFMLLVLTSLISVQQGVLGADGAQLLVGVAHPDLRRRRAREAARRRAQTRLDRRADAGSGGAPEHGAAAGVRGAARVATAGW